jgi:hypothetical protein
VIKFNIIEISNNIKLGPVLLEKNDIRDFSRSLYSFQTHFAMKKQIKLLKNLDVIATQ